MIHRHRGESAEAEQSWRRILGLSRPEQFASLDMGIYGHLTRRNLAVLAAERGDPAEASRLWREVLAECPGDREALAKLDHPERSRIESGSGPSFAISTGSSTRRQGCPIGMDSIPRPGDST